MNYITILGFIAGALTSFASFPQAIKSWQTKSTKDVSLLMFSILCIGIILWLTYAILNKDIPLMVANIVTFIPAFSVLILKLKYK